MAGLAALRAHRHEEIPRRGGVVGPAGGESNRVYASLKQARAKLAKGGSAPYDDVIRGTEELHGLPEGLLARLLKRESNFNPSAKSSAGALGIAQFMPQTAKEMGIDPLDPMAAIPAAGRYLKRMYDKVGDWRHALAAYNWGLGNLQKKGIERAPAETRAYMDAILPQQGDVEPMQSVANAAPQAPFTARQGADGEGAVSRGSGEPLSPTSPFAAPAAAASAQIAPRGTAPIAKAIAESLTNPLSRSKVLRELSHDDAFDLLLMLGGDDEDERDGLLMLLADLEGDEADAIEGGA